MAQVLTEKFKNRLMKADKEYRATHGKPLTESKKIMIAEALDNSARILQEALDNSVGTQADVLGRFKKNVLDITNVVMPNLISPEISKTINMDSRSMWLTYRNYTAGSDKSPFAMGDLIRGTKRNIDPQSEYTSRKVKAGATATASLTEIVLKWTPVLDQSIELSLTKSGTTTKYIDIGGNKFYAESDITGFEESFDNRGNIVKTYTLAAGATQVTTITYIPGSTRDGNYDSTKTTGDANKMWGKITLSGASALASGDKYEVVYAYNNEYVPQNDIPLLTMKQKGISLVAQPRDLQIYYSLEAQYEAKNDYNLDMLSELTTQAEFEVAYEMDTAVVEEICKAATGSTKDDEGLVTDNSVALATWYAGRPIGVSLRDHYAGLLDTLLVADAKLFKRSNKFNATFIMVNPVDKRFFTFLPEYKVKEEKFGAGPFIAGSVDGKTVICSPSVAEGKVIIGVNTPDVFAAIHGIYMPLTHTQVLQFPDGSTTQGFKSLDCVKVVNPALLAHFVINPAVGDASVTASTTTTIAGNDSTHPLFNQVVTG